MVESSRPSIQIDLDEFKLHLHLKNKTQLTLHFNSPSRRFYLSVIALVVHEMKRGGKIKSISLQEHLDLIALLNGSIGGAAGSSDKVNLLNRIYMKWKDALPNLEEGPLFKVLGRNKEDGAIGKMYLFSDAEKDGWANLFEYVGSHENIRLKFAVDKIGVSLDETSIIFGDFRNEEVWGQFISSLKKEEEKEESEVASVDRMKFPLPDKASIAVLPFVNMSEDPKQEFLCDGMSETIITALCKVPSLFVIARNSTFIYKGKPVKISRVSEDLGVQYVLEGSLQRTGGRVRITVQLIDALSGNHLWAERYDRDLQDIFALQDEITIKIITAVRVKLILGGEVSMAAKYAEKYYRGTQGLDCYLKLTQATEYRRCWNIAENNLARRMAEEAIAMCPENPEGYVSLGWVYHHDYWLGNTKSPQETIERGIELAQKALAIDDFFGAHVLLCELYPCKGEFDTAISEGEQAMALNPGATPTLTAYANALRLAGRPKEAIPLFQKAIRLNPFGPSYLYFNFGDTLRVTGRFEEAVLAIKKAIRIAPDSILAHINLAATYSMMGREKEARAEAAEVLRIDPNFSLDDYGRAIPGKERSGIDRYINILRKAGLK